MFGEGRSCMIHKDAADLAEVHGGDEVCARMLPVRADNDHAHTCKNYAAERSGTDAAAEAVPAWASPAQKHAGVNLLWAPGADGSKHVATDVREDTNDNHNALGSVAVGTEAGILRNHGQTARDSRRAGKPAEKVQTHPGTPRKRKSAEMCTMHKPSAKLVKMIRVMPDTYRFANSVISMRNSCVLFVKVRLNSPVLLQFAARNVAVEWRRHASK